MIVPTAAAILMALWIQAPSQPREDTVPLPVRWMVKSAPAGSIAPGARFQIVLEARIEPGWHLYALQEPAGGPMAIEIALSTTAAADLLRVDEQKPRRGIDPQSHLLTNYFEGIASFSLQLQAQGGRNTGPHTLLVSLRYQTCNDRICLPPRRQVLNVPLQIQP